MEASSSSSSLATFIGERQACLVRDLDAPVLVRRLETLGVLSSEQRSVVESECSKRRQNAALLDALLRCDEQMEATVLAAIGETQSARLIATTDERSLMLPDDQQAVASGQQPLQAGEMARLILDSIESLSSPKLSAR